MLSDAVTRVRGQNSRYMPFLINLFNSKVVGRVWRRNDGITVQRLVNAALARAKRGLGVTDRSYDRLLGTEPAFGKLAAFLGARPSGFPIRSAAAHRLHLPWAAALDASIIAGQWKTPVGTSKPVRLYRVPSMPPPRSASTLHDHTC